MKVIKTDEMKVPVKMWLDEIEAGALEQAINLSKLPFVFKHVAIMPDCHQGYGMPIGGVLATKGVVIPNAVGVDIGCGMIALKTSLKEIDRTSLLKIIDKIKKIIPVGFNHHKEKQAWNGFSQAPLTEIVQQELESAKYQLGTLGGGNHFIEIQKGNDGFIWIMIHSGSRNIGLKIANFYHKKAVALCEKWYSDLPNKDLSFLPIGTKEASEYFESMLFALEFAKESRLRMLGEVTDIFEAFFSEMKFNEAINIHHNYANYENHFGSNVIVHRKGATSASLGEPGIIPGSQGTKSYIVRGKGNPDSFMSCSHGAGRTMGRKQAQRELNLEKEKKILDDQGIIHSIVNIDDLDEASSAYKDISAVMENQKNLVDIEVELTPLGVVKG